MSQDLRTPLARAKGLGSAKEGSHHWKAQRISAVALVPLTVWFLLHLTCSLTVDWQETVIWVAMPLNTTLLVLLVLTSFYHAFLGLQVVIEDYVHCSSIKNSMLIFTKFLLIVFATLSIVFIVKIFLLGFVI